MGKACGVPVAMLLGHSRAPNPLRLAIDVRTFTGKVFPASLAALNEIRRLTPLEQVPAYSPALDMPSG